MSYAEFNAIRIGIASPEQIREWSYGEVKKPETINYRTLKPERDGLFCERIFGPTKDWECHCGKYKKIRFKGKVCDRCGVEVTRAKVRRERMGHIELAAPVSHIWYFKGIPSRMGLLLDISPRILEKVLYFAAYIVTDPGPEYTHLTKNQILSDAEYKKLREYYEDDFDASMGAEAVKKLLADLDLEELSTSLRAQMKSASGQKKAKLVKRLEVVDAFRQSGNKPEWMVIDVLPVIPPELRPMVQLDGGRFATSDLNDLYRRVINRNNRLKRLIQLNAPDIIVRNEKRMLQEAVDALIDNGRRGRAVTGANNRALKSLSDLLKGKQGRFRQNLLGKRVDYSGRSVIVVGPELKIYQCGVPKEMAIELFRPFVMKKLVESKESNVGNIKAAKKEVDKGTPAVWDALESVIKEHPVMLNRAPTLHRLGIQAFEPVLVEGRAMKLHPLVCTAFNADFDGDQMAIHVPLSAEAQAEARILMLAANNLLKPSDGGPVTVPTQDMVLGSYYLTYERDPKYDPDFSYQTPADAVRALSNGEVAENDRVWVWDEARQRWYRTTAPLCAEVKDIKIREELSESFGGAILSQGKARWQLVWNEKAKQEDQHWFRVNLRDEKGKEIKESDRDPKALDMSSSGSVMEDGWVLVWNRKARCWFRANPDANAREVYNVFSDDNEAQLAYAEGILDLHEPIMVRRTAEIDGKTRHKLVRTTVGRLLFNEGIPQDLDFVDRNDPEQVFEPEINFMCGKKQLGKIIDRCIAKHGFTRSAEVLDIIKARGYKFSTRGALTVAIADMTVPDEKRPLIAKTEQDIVQIENKYKHGFLTDDERYRLVCDTWKKTTDEVSKALQRSMDRYNPIFMMADSGARGSQAQIRQLAGMRGLMADTSGREIEIPIKSNFREGLTVLEYFISSRGARKGMADTALRTADSGYLTRRLVDVSQEVIIREEDCGTDDGITVSEINEGGKVIELLVERLRGRYLTEDFTDPKTGKVLVSRDQLVDSDLAAFIEKELIKQTNGKIIAQMMKRLQGSELEEYSVDPDTGKDLDSRDILVDDELADFIEKALIEQSGGELLAGGVLVSRDIPVEGGPAKRVEYRIPTRTENEPDHKPTIRVRSVLTCEAHSGVCAKCYGMNLAFSEPVGMGEAVGIIAAQSIGEPGTQLTMRTFHTGGVAGGDITQGLPRVEELLEARKPKKMAQLADISGVVTVEKGKLDTLCIITITADDGEVISYPSVPKSSGIRVKSGDRVTKGQRLTDGALSPHEVLRVRGVDAVHNYLIQEVQKPYRQQGVDINDKHIEVIVRQMMRKVRAEEAGDSSLLSGSTIDIIEFRDALAAVRARAAAGETREDGEPLVEPTCTRLLLGITKASLATESFLSAASFQETTKVLTEAAIKGKVDHLLGLKENVIIGKLIPAGSGLAAYRKLDEIEDEVHDEGRFREVSVMAADMRDDDDPAPGAGDGDEPETDSEAEEDKDEVVSITLDGEDEDSED